MIKKLVGTFPAVTMSILNLAAGGVCALIGHPEWAPVFVVVAALFLGLHTQVVSKKQANETTVKAASDAAMTTAANLTVETVGKLGEVTGDATKVATDAVGLVTGLLGIK